MLKHLTFGLLAGTLAFGTWAQTVTDIKADSGSSAYIQDSRGVIVRSGTGLCWRTGYWTPADSIAGCDGAIVPPILKATAPPLGNVPPSAPIAVVTPPVETRCDFAVTLENDQTFGFNRAALSNAAKRRIDSEVIGKLASCTKIDLVLVTGHSDKIGSAAYNQKLSERRAKNVASYLKAKGVSAKLETSGAGATKPAQRCDTALPRQNLIACLAPNRRVVIEVRGTTS